MSGSVVSGHSHRPTTKTSHKAFKSRKATKGALRAEAKGAFVFYLSSKNVEIPGANLNVLLILVVCRQDREGSA